MLKDIINGELPSITMKKMLLADPTLNNYDLGGLLIDEFPEINSEAVQIVWHWKRPGKAQGISDENFDKLILTLLKESKYI
jgi:hypothetical protein